MKLADTFAKLNRLQHTLWFKVVASGVLVAAAAAAIVYYSVATADVDRGLIEVQRTSETTPGASGTPAAEGTPGVDTSSDRSGETVRHVDADAEQQAANQVMRAGEAWVRFFNDLAGSRFSSGSFALGIAELLGVGLAVVWLGVGLTYLGVILLGAATAWPMIAFGKGFWHDAGYFVAGALALSAAFSALIQVLRALFWAPHPITAIARNVVAEAVRMKLSLIFIVLAIFMLASLPALMDPDIPLRYRVQNFLQYGTTGSYLLTAVLVLLLSVGSVAGEQRDKVIWQTMTKPVRSWQYVLGKWLGVLGVATVLMTVSGTGVFMFTEYLRHQKAQGEIAPFVDESGQPGEISEDRLVLESQILVARISELPTLPYDLAERVDQEANRRLVQATKAYEANPSANDPPDPVKIRADTQRDGLSSFFSIAPAQWKTFDFKELKDAITVNRPITLRYKVQAGGNMPDVLYRVTFYVNGAEPFVRQVHLDQMLTMPLSTAAIGMDGILSLQINNGDYLQKVPNAETITFPPGGLEVSYPVATWQSNFLRVMLVMLFKLAFLSMIAITAATFLSFPVATMVAFGLFMAAEGSVMMVKALEQFGPADRDGNYEWWRMGVFWIASAVTETFRWYGQLRTTESLVEGRLFGWADVGRAFLLLSAVTSVLFVIGSTIFRGRELATYSGQ